MRRSEKQRLNLARRRKDYDAMVAKDLKLKESMRRPGSQKKG